MSTLSAIVDFRVNKFSGGIVTELESGITNGVVEQRGEMKYVTQRPSIDISLDASVGGGGSRGRAIYFWEQTNDLYILNDGTLYQGNYGSSLSTSPTAGTRKCKFLEVEDELVLFDAANGQGFTISDAGVVAEITDLDFPPKQTPAVSLAQGAAYLDGYVFVLGVNGTVYNADLDAPATWGALSFITAEREPDVGQYIGKHHDHIAVLNTSTIEFFYNDPNNAQQPNGSPLSRRQDIFHNLGCVSGDSVYENGDVITFIGSDSSGAIGLYQIQNFAVRKLPNSTIDSFVTQAIVKDGVQVFGTGFSAQGHSYYVLTLHEITGDINPVITLVYDLTTNTWLEWGTAVAGLSNLPFIDWTRRTSTNTQFGQGIFSNGDVATINDNNIPLDTVGGDSYVISGYVDAGYVDLSSNIGDNINMKVRFGLIDGETNYWKYCSVIKPLANDTINSNDLILRWSNENSASFTSTRTLDTSLNSRAFRCGRFRRRNHEIEYAGDEQLRFQSLELTVKKGTN